MNKDLIFTKETADVLGVSTVTLRQWRNRKLLGCTFFSADERHGDNWYYERNASNSSKNFTKKAFCRICTSLRRRFQFII